MPRNSPFPLPLAFSRASRDWGANPAVSPTNTKREEGSFTNYWSLFNMADKYSFNSPPPFKPVVLCSLLSPANAPLLLTQKTYLCDSDQPVSRPFILRKVIFLCFPFSNSSALGGTTFPLNPPRPPFLLVSQTSLSFNLTHPGKNSDGVFFDPFICCRFWVWVCVRVRPFLPRCPLFGGRTRRMSRGVELQYTKWGFVFS